MVYISGMGQDCGSILGAHGLDSRKDEPRVLEAYGSALSPEPGMDTNNAINDSIPTYMSDINTYICIYVYIYICNSVL